MPTDTLTPNKSADAAILVGQRPDGTFGVVALDADGNVRTVDGSGVDMPFVTAVPALGTPGLAIYVVDGLIATESRDKVMEDPATGAGGFPVRVIPDGLVYASIDMIARAIGAQPTANALSVSQATDATFAVAAAELPLPAGAALESGGNLAAVAANTARIPPIGQALAAGSTPVVLPAAQQASLAPPTTAAAPGATRLSDGSAFYKATTPADTQPVSAVSLPLPTGASTAAGVVEVRDRLPYALGQQLAAASLPVVLPALQAAAIAQEATLQALLARFMPTDTPSYAPATSLASGIIKASAGTLWTIYALSNVAIDLWLMTFNTTTVPANGTSPVDVVQVARENNGQAFIDTVKVHTTGIVWAASTTRETLTLHGGTPFLIRARYQ